MSLIVTGSITIDSVDAPTGSVRDVIGGSAVYFSAAASYFGPVRLVGAVGEDCPDTFYEVLDHFGVDRIGMEKRIGSKTFRWHGRYLENMNQRETVKVELNVLTEALPPVPESFRDSKYVFLAVTNPANQLALLDQFPQRKLVVADTIDLYINTEREELEEVIRRVDGLIINDAEAKMLTEKSNMISAADELLSRGPSFVVIKKGEHGVIMRHADGWAALPAFPTDKVIDPTGAGDSFAGGMMGHLAAADDLSLPTVRQALAYGTVVASYVIEDFSVERIKSVKRSDIDERFEAFSHLMRI